MNKRYQNVAKVVLKPPIPTPSTHQLNNENSRCDYFFDFWTLRITNSVVRVDVATRYFCQELFNLRNKFLPSNHLLYGVMNRFTRVVTTKTARTFLTWIEEPWFLDGTKLPTVWKLFIGKKAHRPRLGWLSLDIVWCKLRHGTYLSALWLVRLFWCENLQYYQAMNISKSKHEKYQGGYTLIPTIFALRSTCNDLSRHSFSSVTRWPSSCPFQFSLCPGAKGLYGFTTFIFPFYLKIAE